MRNTSNCCSSCSLHSPQYGDPDHLIWSHQYVDHSEKLLINQRFSLPILYLCNIGIPCSIKNPISIALQKSGSSHLILKNSFLHNRENFKPNICNTKESLMQHKHAQKVSQLVRFSKTGSSTAEHNSTAITTIVRGTCSYRC